MRTAIVTGSTGGIGEAIARRLAADGLAVIVSGRRVAIGEEVARTIRSAGGEATYLHADVANPDDCVNLIHGAVKRYGRLDVLVNNAAIYSQMPISALTPEQWDLEFAVNARAPFLCSREALPHLRAVGGGSIINIGTTMVHGYGWGHLERMGYIGSKGALLAMTKSMARELAHERIRVNWVIVGWVATPGEIALRAGQVEDPEAYLAERGKDLPLGRMELPEEVAAGVAFLVSEEASHVTGCELNVSGGIWVG
ncbi:MAG: SDR family oxidoreductase [Chloroflexi bacterium]|nr:SDR family oxidoreductase [Chloroflexota bacterium]